VARPLWAHRQKGVLGDPLLVCMPTRSRTRRCLTRGSLREGGPAYFYGFFRNKRIVLFDTLLKQMDEAEVIAVLGRAASDCLSVCVCVCVCVRMIARQSH
jgi:hypothetical protein